MCQKIPGELTQSYEGIRQDLTDASSPQAAVTDLRTQASGWRQTAQAASAYPQLNQATITLANTLDTLAQTTSSGQAIAIGSAGMTLESEWNAILKAQKQAC